VFAAAAVSFVVGSMILRFVPAKEEETEAAPRTVPGSARVTA
jgi:mannitol-specific phosphotransferase system IIBC component